MTNHSPRAKHQQLNHRLGWYCGVLLGLILITIVLVTKLSLDWRVAEKSTARLSTGGRLELEPLTAATIPLRGLDSRVALTRETIDSFLAQRIPANYSSIATDIAEIEDRSGVRLMHMGYSQGSRGTDLTEIYVDCGITGEYPQIMRFVNGLERHHTFFAIRAMTLTGQQGGIVNLRLRFSTWLRPAAANELPAADVADTKPGISKTY